jgi:ribosome recycling factor
MNQLPVLTFETQRTFWKLLREYTESSTDVTVQRVRKDGQATLRATKRHEKARSELTRFVDSITEKPTMEKP